MKKAVALIVLLTLLAGILGACGGAEESPYAGTYKVVELEGMSAEEYQEITGEDLSEMFTFELKSGGKGTITVDGDTGNIKWEVDDSGNIKISEGSDEVTGTMDGNRMSLTIEGLSVVLEKE